MRRILVYCPVTLGGIYDYTLEQSRALAAAGIEVTLLTVNTVELSNGIRVVPALQPESDSGCGRWVRLARMAHRIHSNFVLLRRHIIKHDHRQVLMSTYSEYGAPLWAPPLASLARRGVRFGAILHDPLRTYRVGPPWFHQWSIQSGYSYLRDVFVHDPISRAEAGIPAHVQVTVVPHGPYQFPLPPVGERLDIRAQMGIPDDAKVVLSFGQIRAGKNLHLVIEALADFPDLWLLVAGQESGGGAPLLPQYQEMAVRWGVARRCRWHQGFVPAAQVGAYFEAADLVLLTYSRHFRSASGVLNTAVAYQRPCLASSGPGALCSQTAKYGLGIWVEPDRADTIREGLARWQAGIPEPEWEGYRRDNSWEENAGRVAQQMFGTP